jgi:FkbM family methyltransferase
LKDWIRGKLRARRAKRRLNSKPVMTKHGFKFSGPDVMTSGDFEPTETEVLKKLLVDCDQFVNVGANFGYYICLAQSMNVRAEAVEPVPLNLELLKRNLRSNGYDENVTVHACACGEKTGEMEIFGVGTGASLVKGWARNPKSLRNVVQIRRLDEIISPESVSDRTLFLVDVEGFELQVMKGAEALLSAPNQPIWMLESGLSDHREHGQLNSAFLEVFDFVVDRGYRVCSVSNPEITIQREQITQSLNEGKDLIGELNFLLIPKGRSLN